MLSQHGTLLGANGSRPIPHISTPVEALIISFMGNHIFLYLLHEHICATTEQKPLLSRLLLCLTIAIHRSLSVLIAAYSPPEK